MSETKPCGHNKKYLSHGQKRTVSDNGWSVHYHRTCSWWTTGVCNGLGCYCSKCRALESALGGKAEQSADTNSHEVRRARGAV
jgi:hypothetical protein